jgi:hypothetical protein
MLGFVATLLLFRSSAGASPARKSCSNAQLSRLGRGYMIQVRNLIVIKLEIQKCHNHKQLTSTPHTHVVCGLSSGILPLPFQGRKQKCNPPKII